MSVLKISIKIAIIFLGASRVNLCIQGFAVPSALTTMLTGSLKVKQ